MLGLVSRWLLSLSHFDSSRTLTTENPGELVLVLVPAVAAELQLLPVLVPGFPFALTT
jgi:hypothetical protein